MLKTTQKSANLFGRTEQKAYLCTRFSAVRAFSSVGLEHLPYKQRVGGSNPSTPTHSIKQTASRATGGFQSGQMGQTVNLLLLASVVRIHHHPPRERGYPDFKVKDSLVFGLKRECRQASDGTPRISHQQQEAIPKKTTTQ